MLDQQHRQAERVQALDLLGQFQRLRRVHPGGRLVQQQDVRARGQRAGDLDPPPVGIRQMADRLARPAGSSRLPKMARISIAQTRAAASSRRVPGGRNTAAIGPVFSRACWPISTLSSTVRLVNSRMFWNVRAIPGRRISCGGRPSRSSPSNRIVPLSAGVSPVITLNNVDLPDPFGPITATTPPVGTRRSTLFSAIRPPKRTVTPFTSRPLRRAARSPRPGQSGEAAATHLGVLLLEAQCGLLSGRRDQPVAAKQHHENQDETEDQLDRLGQVDLLQPGLVDRGAEGVDPAGHVLQKPGLQQLQDDGAEHDAPDAAHAAEHDHHQDHHRDREAEHLRCRGLQLGDIEHAGDAGEGGADGERQQFRARAIHAHRRRRHLILPDRHPGAADARIAQSDTDENQQRHQAMAT